MSKTDPVPGLVRLTVSPRRKKNCNSRIHMDKCRIIAPLALLERYKTQGKPKVEGFDLIRVRENSSEQR